MSNGNRPSEAQQKQTLLMLAGAFSLLCVMLTFIVKTPAKLGPVSIGVGVLAALGCILWTALRVGPSITSGNFARFQTNVLVSLAFAEMVTLSGASLGSQPTGAYLFLSTTLLLVFALIIPAIKRFFR